MKKEITAEGVVGTFFDKCLDPTCGSDAIFLRVDDYLGAQVTWCRKGHVCAFDPELDQAPKNVYTFVDQDQNLGKGGDNDDDH